jgi:hypothetical protein
VRARAAALPQSTLGKACNYALGQWASLGRYAIAGNGIVEIDNNWAENAMRGVALGRKNWLHVGSEAAGPRIAALYSVLESCKRLRINPREYLGDVLPRLADWNMSRIAELTPSAWQRAQSPMPAGCGQSRAGSGRCRRRVYPRPPRLVVADENRRTPQHPRIMPARPARW